MFSKKQCWHVAGVICYFYGAPKVCAATQSIVQYSLWWNGFLCSQLDIFRTRRRSTVKSINEFSRVIRSPSVRFNYICEPLGHKRPFDIWVISVVTKFIVVVIADSWLNVKLSPRLFRLGCDTARVLNLARLRRIINRSAVRCNRAREVPPSGGAARHSVLA